MVSWAYFDARHKTLSKGTGFIRISDRHELFWETFDLSWEGKIYIFNKPRAGRVVFDLIRDFKGRAFLKEQGILKAIGAKISELFQNICCLKLYHLGFLSIGKLFGFPSSAEF